MAEIRIKHGLDGKEGEIASKFKAEPIEYWIGEENGRIESDRLS